MPHVEPAPEELHKNAQVQGLFEEKVDDQDAEGVELREEQAGYHYVAADEREA